MTTKDYKIKKNNHLFQFSIPRTTGSPEAFSKSFMSEPIKGVKFYMVDSSVDQLNISAALVYDIDKHLQNLFVMDMTDVYIGNYTLLGMIVDYVENFGDFIEDIKAGAIDLVVINLDKSSRPNTQGILVEELIRLCGKNCQPVAHVFVTSEEQLITINDEMKDFFLKNNGQLLEAGGEPEQGTL